MNPVAKMETSPCGLILETFEPKYREAYIFPAVSSARPSLKIEFETIVVTVCAELFETIAERIRIFGIIS